MVFVVNRIIYSNFATLFGVTAGRGRVMSHVVLERQTIFN